jgi:titin
VLGGGAQNSIIGGKERGEANVISGNQSAGVLIRGSGTSGNVIKGNFIGPDSSGSKELRQGTEIWMLEGPQGNVIGGTAEGEGNIIAHSGTVGVLIDGADTTGNTIRGNSIRSDGRDAIVSKNGGNLGLAQPTIGSAGPLRGTACAGCTVDVYSGSEESQVYEGSTTADASGAFTFDGALSGSLVTATATDAGGNTSPYSEPFAAPTN